MKKMQQALLPLFISLLFSATVQSVPCIVSDEITDPGIFVDFDGELPENVSPHGCMPMRSADIRGSIVDGIVEVTLTQEFETYVCPFCFWPDFGLAQGRYQLPLDEKAAVTAFRAEIGDRVIDGIVKDKDEAEQEYNDAVEAGKPAALAEQTRPDIFKISIGNMPPNEVVRVILTYVAPLEVFGADTYRFVLPTSIAPRYHPRDEDEPIPNLTPLLNNGVQIGLGVVSSADIDVKSLTHTLNVMKVTDTVDVIQVIDTDPLERDLVIDMEASSVPFDPQIFIEESSNGTHAMMMSWVPQFNLSETMENVSKKEFIFILDRSGSMGNGNKITQLETAMSTIMQSLPSDSLFNIVGFGSNYQFLFEEGSEPVSNETSYNTALSYIDSLLANFGGTEIFSPIQAVLTSPPVPYHQRIVFLMTDGQVSNENQIINYVGDNLGSSRIFTLGIGPAAARTLLNGVARNGAGTSDYVNGDSDVAIVDAVTSQMAIALGSPPLTIQSVVFNNLATVQAPHRSPSFFLGKRLLLYYLIDIDSDGRDSPTNVSITVVDSTNATGPFLYEIASSDFIQTSSVFESDIIHKMGAREMIRDLEEGRSPLHDEDQNEPTDAEVEERIVAIGVKYQIISSETSFVAVDNEGWTAISKEVDKTGENGNPDSGGSMPGPSPTVPTYGFICFSPVNTVITRDKGMISIKDLKIGDEVDVGNGQFSAVYSFGHYDIFQPSTYIQLYIGRKSLELSSDHLVYTYTKGMIAASEVIIGDQLRLGNGERAFVDKISTVDRIGAYAPFTMSGSIVVSNVVASCYVSFPEVSKAFQVVTRNIVSMHWLSHAFQAPHRFFCSVIHPSACSREQYTDMGISTWVHGPLLATQWLISWGSTALHIFAIPITLAAILLCLVEMIITSSVAKYAIILVGIISVAANQVKSKVA
mmetsp:Transcript_8048/g.12312  ORF Transcript_8048/g.12312 Transcript_8048/m.12312 type:complete len:924 (+) Transcript_8048:230-3001(+)